MNYLPISLICGVESPSYEQLKQALYLNIIQSRVPVYSLGYHDAVDRTIKYYLEKWYE